MSETTAARAVNRPGQVLFASLIGTAIEFFDFYIYATAAVLFFPRLFFPPSDPASSTLASLATFAIAFLARPIGSALFGHFGDRIGRKQTLVAGRGAGGAELGGSGFGGERLASALLELWHCGAPAAVAVPLRTGSGPGWGVGWRRAAG